MKSFVRLTAIALLALASCTADAPGGDGETPEDDQLEGDPADIGDPDPIVPGDDTSMTGNNRLTIGGPAVVCKASALNQRSAPSAFSSILKVLPGGATTKILAESGGWYKHDWNGSVGWSNGDFLCTPNEGDDPNEPGVNPDGIDSRSIDVPSFLAIAKATVGFSYWWGGGRFAEGVNPGSCSGACPNCTHRGSYGGDCSGYLAKVWLLPMALPMDQNLHPYSTASFVGTSSLWRSVPRSEIKTGDALVYRSNGAGHILMYHKGDAWGSFWAYESRSCAYGVTHNTRYAGSHYKTIRRTGV